MFRLPITVTSIPLGLDGLTLDICDGIAAVLYRGACLDSAADIDDAAARLMIADARRWVLLGHAEAEAWFRRALAMVRTARHQLLAAE
ncbi:hypothetical protein E6C67_14380 [Azospirillum sp. TSA2s]|uniref:hypothetical protein n=1 Tax=Azospirillum sp. TSA2s TaxID=709810 RepID=UPI0010AA826E|nr:hypothetical protein [Azospirillum sp. TSA2s]QCG95013.1 hypothetical protein E6C67_14380 [Azospirillum sp. TSA2s]